MIDYLMQQYYDEGVQVEEEWDGGKQAAEHCPSTWHMLQNDRVRVASFGAGCYWGTEKYFAKDFAKEFPGAILGTAVGFMNPD